MNEQQNTSNTPFRGPGGILIIDNYDSFTYNLVHLVNELGLQCEVWRNDKFAISDVDAFDKIILSPGPGIPSEAGLLLDVIEKYSPTKSIFGVCLGQQAIAEVFGGSLYNLSQPMHGVATPIKVTNSQEQLFKGLPESFKVGRYHSWVVSDKNLPEVLQVTAIDDADNSIMALTHREYDVRGVQFHPESVLTEYGKQLMQNWLS
ncbi:aminodeoxychorismate/anthranilate synthase component II [Mucilaginibacter sabulilitoris]|uniref:Aminodeoxychorismate/anthranilate synthase component II n=1 Tax=Mucilaginibacter sabulilitoris TaxID=1173583 RepID=A0ABZ0TQW1_9SPHI|nr:aminodeoxychorismate/anthranilate synthase component II [Mucilaginibacter sabulilitoris]WPU94488.1 aminodeoxychorismate/anthranilate synthase component II [Mucilaginibacter sabulilitoris]